MEVETVSNPLTLSRKADRLTVPTSESNESQHPEDKLNGTTQHELPVYDAQAWEVLMNDQQTGEGDGWVMEEFGTLSSVDGRLTTAVNASEASESESISSYLDDDEFEELEDDDDSSSGVNGTITPEKVPSTEKTAVEIPVAVVPHSGKISPRRTVSVMLQQPKAKKLEPADMVSLVQLFNQKPKKAIDAMVDKGYISSGDDLEPIAHFLFCAENLDKKLLGEFLGKPENRELFERFIAQLDFTDLDFDMALRRLLVTYRLPGEGQVIDRMMRVFASRYFHCNPKGHFKSSDAAYVLAYSCIMLNTDAHSNNVKGKMNKNSFIGNTHNAAACKNIPSTYLSHLYDRIVEDEIKMENEPFPRAVKSGWLTLKRSSLLGSQKKLWFILSDTILYALKRPGMGINEVTMKITLANKIVMKKSEENSHFLIIKDQEKKGHDDANTVIKIPSEKELQSWLNWIGKGMSELRAQQQQQQHTTTATTAATTTSTTNNKQEKMTTSSKPK